MSSVGLSGVTAFLRILVVAAFATLALLASAACAGRFLWRRRTNGILSRLDGEVSWLLPDGPKPYWRGRITDIRHEFAR